MVRPYEMNSAQPLHFVQGKQEWLRYVMVGRLL
jgi:hypothetical protein